MRILICLAVLFTALSAKAAGTNNTYSQTTIAYMLSTNSVAYSNSTYTAGFNASSNMLWTYTNGAISTNFAVIIPNSQTNWLCITNGLLHRVSTTNP